MDREAAATVCGDRHLGVGAMVAVTLDVSQALPMAHPSCSGVLAIPTEPSGCWHSPACSLVAAHAIVSATCVISRWVGSHWFPTLSPWVVVPRGGVVFHLGWRCYNGGTWIGCGDVEADWTTWDLCL